MTEICWREKLFLYQQVHNLVFPVLEWESIAVHNHFPFENDNCIFKVVNSSRIKVDWSNFSSRKNFGAFSTCSRREIQFPYRMKMTPNSDNYVYFSLFRSHVLQKVCMYFTYKVRYTNSSTEIPEFPISPEIALELLMAANFLDCWKFMYLFEQTNDFLTIL